MACTDMSLLIDLYVDNALPEEARARLERHTLTCTACAHQLRGAEQTLAHLRDAYPREEAGPGFRGRLAARLEAAFAEEVVSAHPIESTQLPLPMCRQPR